jgi:PAS domain S-box-containing protein
MTTQKNHLAQEIILTVSRILARDIPYEQAITEVLKEMCSRLSWVSASFWTFRRDHDALSCEMHYCGEPCPTFREVTEKLVLSRGQGLPGQVWEKQDAIWISDVSTADNFPRRHAAQKDGLHCALGFPVTVKGKFVGVFEFFSAVIAQPDEDLLNAFRVVSTELGQFFERRRAEVELAAQANLTEYAAEIGTIVNGTEPLADILKQCAEMTLKHLPVKGCRIGCSAREADDFAPAEAQAGDVSAITSSFRLEMQDACLGSIDLNATNPLTNFEEQVLHRAANNISLCAARKISEAKLLASESRFREFAAVVDETFFVSTPNLKSHFYISPAFEKMWGRPVSEAFQNPDIWLDAVLPEHRERVTAYRALLSGETMPDAAEIDYPIRRPDGSIRWLSARCFRINQRDGSWHICGTVRDITERKRAEERISDFYAMVSHELRTPMASIKGSLLLLERQKAGELPAPAVDLILLARKECDRLIRLINDMLDIKTLQVGKLEIYRQYLRAGDLVEQTIANILPLAAERNIKVTPEVRTDAQLFADRDRIVQVLTNLLSNALKFSPPGSEIVVSVEKNGEQVRCAVTDQGEGIAVEDQEHVFKIFERVGPREAPERRGTGLGLPISKGIIDEHGGRIDFVSAKGRGSTFWFELPIHSPSEFIPDAD